MDLVARLAVLLACAVAAGALLVLVARPPARPADGGRRPGDASPGPAPLRGIPGAVPAGLAAFVVVAGGTAITGAGAVAGSAGPIGLARVAGVAMLVVAGVLLVAAVRGRRRIRAASVHALAWLGAGVALASPFVLVVAVPAILVVDVRVAPRT